MWFEHHQDPFANVFIDWIIVFPDTFSGYGYGNLAKRDKPHTDGYAGSVCMDIPGIPSMAILAWNAKGWNILRYGNTRARDFKFVEQNGRDTPVRQSELA